MEFLLTWEDFTQGMSSSKATLAIQMFFRSNAPSTLWLLEGEKTFRQYMGQIRAVLRIFRYVVTTNNYWTVHGHMKVHLLVSFAPTNATLVPMELGSAVSTSAERYTRGSWLLHCTWNLAPLRLMAWIFYHSACFSNNGSWMSREEMKGKFSLMPTGEC